MEKVAVVLPRGSFVPDKTQGAIQTNAFESAKLYRKHEPYIFSSAIKGKPAIETVSNVNIIRIADRVFDLMLGDDTAYVSRVASEIHGSAIKLVHIRNRPVYALKLRKILGSSAKIILHQQNQNIADTLSRKNAIEVLNSIDAYVGVSKFTMDYEIANKYPEFADKAHFIFRRSETCGRYGPGRSRTHGKTLFVGARCRRDRIIIWFIAEIILFLRTIRK